MYFLPKEYLSQLESNIATFWNVLKTCVKIKKNEKILIISDYGNTNHNLSYLLAKGYQRALEKKGFVVEFLIQDIKKGFMHVDSHVRKALELLPKNNIVIVSVSNKLGRFGEHKSFRQFAREKGHRFLSASGLKDARNSQFPLFMEAMKINYSRMQKRGKAIKKLWDKGKTLRITTELGTDLHVNISEMNAIANTGEYGELGNGGNLPAGEVYIAPFGTKGVNGKVVLDGSIRYELGSKLLSSPLTMIIESGAVVKMEGADAKLMEDTFSTFEARAKYPERVRLVGEIGFGINPGAVLIGLALMDEKVAGTAHIGIGSNAWFGGAIKTIFHGDQTFKNPTVYIDGMRMEL
jgi:aminopeptidase